MKNKEFNELKKNIALKSTLEIIFYSLISMLVVFLIIDGLLNSSLADLVSSIDWNLYYFFVSNKWVVILVIFMIVIIVVSFFIIKKTSKYFTEIIESIDKIMNNPEDDIKLSKDLFVLEGKLNAIRIDLITSMNNEKEAINKKNDLIMYMAHDLKTPLTSVIGYLTLLSDEKNISKNLSSKYINIALDKSLRLENLINQFFEITRYNLFEVPLVISEFDLSLLFNQLIEECYVMLQEKNLKFNVVKNDKIIFNGDGEKLARAFENLIKNAISYSFKDSVIDIIIVENDENINITFKNKGERIPEYKLQKIFDKFYRADESRNSSTGGTGLGLAITKEIITLHKGTIDVKNDGDYIVFNVVIPK